MDCTEVRHEYAIDRQPLSGQQPVVHLKVQLGHHARQTQIQLGFPFDRCQLLNLLLRKRTVRLEHIARQVNMIRPSLKRCSRLGRIIHMHGQFHLFHSFGLCTLFGLCALFHSSTLFGLIT
ncbi:hypothetical protein D3C77_330360 [compost metagenome]